MMPSSLESAAILPLLDASDPATNKTAWWIAGHHPEWGTALWGISNRGWPRQENGRTVTRSSGSSHSSHGLPRSSNIWRVSSPTDLPKRE